MKGRPGSTGGFAPPEGRNSPAGRVRVLHVTFDAGPFPYPYFRSLGRHADRERFDLSFVSLSRAGVLQEDARRLGLGAGSLDADRRADYPRAALLLARWLRRERVDVVHTHSLDASLIGLLAARGSLRPVGVVTAHHAHETPLQGSRRLSAADGFCMARLPHGVIAPSSQMRDTLVRSHRVAPDKVVVIEHGLELERFQRGAPDRDAVRADLGLEGRLVLGALGRLYWIKNQESLVRAFAPIAASTPEALLLLVGGGDSASLLELARSLGLADRVRVLPQRDDVPELLAAIDLFVHPSLAESFGAVIIEAMAAGKPVVSTPVGIAPDVVEDGATGALAADGTSDGLEGALRKALAQRSRWAAMGAEGRRRSERFSESRMVRDYEAYYLRILERAGWPRTGQGNGRSGQV